mgnify:CR=1 FL=1|jgi:hypothetical protein|tara:strand:+ start:282 stop:776 length:495 start_codon:yes stop_codon:yes gene_type:complete
MAYQRLQVSRSLAVIPSTTVLIPDPATEMFAGIADFSVASTLTDVGTTFTTLGIEPGKAIVYNTTAGVAYYITAVTDNLNLALSPATTGGATDSYVIYAHATQACTLYSGTAQDITVYMSADTGNMHAPTTTQKFTAIPAGSFMPTLVTGVSTADTPTNLIALW